MAALFLRPTYLVMPCYMSFYRVIFFGFSWCLTHSKRTCPHTILFCVCMFLCIIFYYYYCFGFCFGLFCFGGGRGHGVFTQKKRGQPRDAIRAVVVLPHSFRPSQRVLVFAEGSQADAARAAGADIVGGAELVSQVVAGELEFDAVLATPALVKEVKAAGRVLRQMTPSVKKGTVSDDIGKLTGEFKGGISYGSDAHGLIAAPFGRTDMTPTQLEANLAKLLGAVRMHCLDGNEAKFVHQLHISAQQGPGMPIDQTSLPLPPS